MDQQAIHDPMATAMLEQNRDAIVHSLPLDLLSGAFFRRPLGFRDSRKV
jgi:hypothetical protein